jgi:hypothetical protein
LKSKYFKNSELFSREFLNICHPVLLERMIPDYAIASLDALRADFGQPITINGGAWTYCGVRPLNCLQGAEKSKHKLGIAFDLHTKELQRLLDLILRDHVKYNICRIEQPKITVPRGWIHVEFDEPPVENFKIFNP